MNIKHRLAKLEAVRSQPSVMPVVFLVDNESLADAKAKVGLSHLADNQLRVIHFEVVG